ncbi:MAG: pantoate--beta-alanine ligase [Deltaproteobacteria bacterium]|nr:pantoate--beta-alanine ligase [Deltaproteobacteria bacterium]
MRVIPSIPEMRAQVLQYKRDGLTIGFVPTMGYFHAGHIALMELARQLTDRVVVSLFVNPTQFGPNEDLSRYPRDMERDTRMAKEAGVDIFFTPDANELYSKAFSTWVNVEGLSEHLCGRSRPGHFRGVATIVAKLFGIVQPDKAVFGQKDFQQLAIIRRMVQDLNMPVEIVAHETVREPDGLAMSSRNTYLSQGERASALCLYQALCKAETALKTEKIGLETLKNAIEGVISAKPFTRIDYIFIGDPNSLQPYDEDGFQKAKEVLAALAVWVGKTRLIDNMCFTKQPH